MRFLLFESALLLVGIKMRSPSCRNAAPLPMLKVCVFHLLRHTLSKSCSFHDSRVTLKSMYRLTERKKISVSLTLNVDPVPPNAQRTSVLKQDDRTQRGDTVQLFTRRATQTSDAIADQTTRRKQGQACLQHKLPTNAQVCTQRSYARNRRSGFVQRRDTACNDKTAHSSMVHSTDTKLRTMRWTHKVPLRSTQQSTEKTLGNRDSTLLP